MNRKICFLAIMLCLMAMPFPANALWLTINTSKSANQATVTKDSETGEFTVVTSGIDPYFYLTAFPAALDSGTDSLTFEYKSSANVYDLQLFFCDPASEERSQHFYNLLKKTDEWTKVTISIADAISKFDWQNAGNYLRIDPGRNSGVTLHFRSFYINSKDNSLSYEQKTRISSHIDTYSKRQFSSAVTNVEVTLSSINVSGTCESDNRKYAVVEIPLYQDITETTSFVSRAEITSKDFTVQFPRRASRNGYTYDRLLSKWAIVDVTDGKDSLVSHARYADEVKAKSSPQAMTLNTKKGLGGFIWNDNRSDLDSLGIGSVTVNVVLNSIVSMTPASGCYSHSYGGKTYYMNASVVNSYDKQFLLCLERGITVSAIILVVPSGGDAKFTDAIRHPEYTTGPYCMPNFTTIAGVQAYAAAIDFLAKRYNGVTYGRINHWILHNEVDQGSYWTNMGTQPLPRYTDSYMKSMRLVSNIVRQYDQNAAVLASFTHSWKSSSGSGNYTTCDMLDFINRMSQAEGDFWWGLAYHPYPEDLTKPQFWKNDTHSTYNLKTSGYVTFKNLEVLSEWMLIPANKYQGTTKRILFLSEQGTNSPSYSASDLKLQAAGACWAWKKVCRLEGIDAMQWHNWQDNRAEGGLRIGLRYYPDDETHPNEPKPVWYVWQAAGTDNEETVFAPYMSTLGISNWESIFRSVIGSVGTASAGKSALDVYGTEGAIVNKSGVPVSVYTAAGALVARTSGNVVLPAGIYIVRSAMQSRKVMVK